MTHGFCNQGLRKGKPTSRRITKTVISKRSPTPASTASWLNHLLVNFAPALCVYVLSFTSQIFPASKKIAPYNGCLLYTSDAADERSSVDLGGRRIIKK